MSMEYASIEFNSRRISVIVHRSASDKLAVDSLVLLVCGLSLPPRERKCFQAKICELVAGKLSKCLYILVYTSATLNECLLVHNFQNSCSTECH